MLWWNCPVTFGIMSVVVVDRLSHNTELYRLGVWQDGQQSLPGTGKSQFLRQHPWHKFGIRPDINSGYIV